MTTRQRYFLMSALALLVLIVAGLGWYLNRNMPKSNQGGQKAEQSIQVTISPQTLGVPLSNAASRVTKKHFGQYITPENSPVQPEKFSGYHTGTDFEIKQDEADVPIPVYAVCDGPIKSKQSIQGYGGTIVQECKIENEIVQVLYGHISVTESSNVGESLVRGDSFAILGTPPTETDGERKHLHLGIIGGSTIDYRGYVEVQPELSKWINPESYLGIQV